MIKKILIIFLTGSFLSCTNTISVASLTGSTTNSDTGNRQSILPDTNSEQIQTDNTEQIRQALIDYQDIEKIFTDSETILSERLNLKTSAFAIKDRISIDENKFIGPVRTSEPETKKKTNTNLRIIKRQVDYSLLKQGDTGTIPDSQILENLSAKLESAGTLTRNSDGTVEIDPEKTKEFLGNNASDIQKLLEITEVKLKERVNILKNQLSFKVDLVGVNKEKLKGKYKNLKISNIIELEESDNKLKIAEISFQYIQFELRTNNIIFQTINPDNKVITTEHYLLIENDQFTRLVFRKTDKEGDVLKTLTSFSTKWKDSDKAVQLYENRTTNLDDYTGTGNGTLKLISEANSTEYQNLDISVNAKGDITLYAIDPISGTNSESNVSGVLDSNN